MAKIKTEKTEVELADGSEITGACEKIGVPFSCYSGICGICKIRILEGMENLSEMTENEKTWGLEKDERLACQCRLKSGDIKIIWGD